MDRIVICRHAIDSLKPGYVLGYNCKECGRALQVGPPGVIVIKEYGGIPLCNPCGFEMQRKYEERDGMAAKVILSPEAQRQVDEWKKEGN